MAIYTAEIDNGQGGEEAITADSAAEAMVMAIEWAQGGDWPEEGCDIELSVVNEDDESDSLTDTVHILSEEEKQNARLDEDGEVLAEDEGEWVTEQVIRLNDEYYYRRNNGGSRGAWDHRTNPDVFECRPLSTREARVELLRMGMEPADVVHATCV